MMKICTFKKICRFFTLTKKNKGSKTKRRRKPKNKKNRMKGGSN